MKNPIRFMVLTICLPLVIAPGALATDFVPVSQADVLVITHASLRTPNWVPGMIGAWETELLAQKQTQGYSVALYAIPDGVDQYSIRQYLENNQGHFKFVYIIGEARRPEGERPDQFTVTISNFDNGNIVPIWREVVQTFWQPYDGLYIIENDRGYIENIDSISVYIGRIPAANIQEIQIYLEKSENYISIEHRFPEWSKNILEAVNDVTSFGNGSSGPYVQAFWDAWEAEFPAGWPVARLAKSTGPATEEGRAWLFENYLDSTHCGLIHVVGTTGCDYLLADWYYWNSQYNFTNFNYLPFMLGMSCHIGAFDRYWEGVENQCVVEKMLFHPDGGIIGAIAPTGATLLPQNCVFPIRFWNVILSQNVLNFGEILNTSIEQATGEVPVADFTLKELILLGDPTLNLPYDLKYEYLPGDANMRNGIWRPAVTGSDLTYMVNFFGSNPCCPGCLLNGFWASADINGDCVILGSDVTRLQNYFRGTATISCCPNYPPLWPTTSQLPPSAPAGWPNCDVTTTSKVIPGQSANQPDNKTD